jgi:hypothetical protein
MDTTVSKTHTNNMDQVTGIGFPENNTCIIVQDVP